MRIRPAELAEIPLMNDVDADAGRLFGTVPAYAFVMDYPPRADSELEAFVVEGRAFVAGSDGLLSGFILMGQVDEAAHIFQVSVRMDFQRAGIGRALVEQGSSWAGRQGFNAVTLTTFRDAPWNAPAYVRLGFTVIDPAQTGPELAAILSEEKRAGLFREPRVAMRRDL